MTRPDCYEIPSAQLMLHLYRGGFQAKSARPQWWATFLRTLRFLLW